MSLSHLSPVSSASRKSKSVNHQSSINPSSATPLLIAASLLAFGFCSSAPAAAVEKIAIAGKPVTIKVPDQPAPGKPWLWVGEFPGHMKSLENGLVEKGWHVVHVGVSNQFGSPRAMDVWEKVYEEMHAKRGLSAKPALLGISRGGLYVTAWTRLHPDRVSALYLDNGVCDIRSWPAGFQLTKQGKGSPKDWKLCKAELGYTSDADAGEKAAKPCDGMLPAIQAGVLLISCHGTADSVVPYEDNAAHLVKLWQDNRGRLKLFPKEGADHHPHGLPDPTPLIAAIDAEGSQIPGESRALSKQAKSAAIPPTHANVPYDVHERTKLDFWQAQGDGPRPLRVYIHGGAWVGGDKSKGAKGVGNDLKKGISVASINYRLSTTDPLPTPVLDAVRAVQFLRHKAKEWNIDKNRIVLTGGSAGGCTSLLIACMDDFADPASDDPVKRQSSRVQAAAVLGAQTCIDPQVAEPWIGPNVWHQMIHQAVGEGTVEGAKANYEKHKDLYRRFSPVNHLSKDDPPLFLNYRGAASVPAKSVDHGIHHPMFGIKLKEKSEGVGHHHLELLIGEKPDPAAQNRFVEGILLRK